MGNPAAFLRAGLWIWSSCLLHAQCCGCLGWLHRRSAECRELPRVQCHGSPASGCHAQVPLTCTWNSQYLTQSLNPKSSDKTCLTLLYVHAEMDVSHQQINLYTYQPCWLFWPHFSLKETPLLWLIQNLMKRIKFWTAQISDLYFLHVICTLAKTSGQDDEDQYKWFLLEVCLVFAISHSKLKP